MDGNSVREQEIKAIISHLAPPSLCICSCAPDSSKFSPSHQDEPQEPKKAPPEDTETDELWASLEAAAKRKLPDLEQTQGPLQTRRRKKQRPGSTSS